MPENPLIARLLDPQQVIVFDGAMGTQLYNKGVFINQCYDELNLRAPDLVRDVHKAYKKAGAEVLETNTFGANRIKLAQYGLESQLADINRAAVKIAREVADDAVPGDDDRIVAANPTRHRHLLMGESLQVGRNRGMNP